MQVPKTAITMNYWNGFGEQSVELEVKRRVIGITVTYEEWPNAGEPGWLLVQIQRKSTGECLSAFTQPSQLSVARRLKADLEGGKPVSTDIEFINYFCKSTDFTDEINDDLNVVTLKGSLEQASALGPPVPRFRVYSESVRSLMTQMLRDRSFVDMKLFEFLGEIAPESFASFADELNLDDDDTGFATEPAGGAADGPTLVLDANSREAHWDNTKLQINGNAEFDLLAALHQANGKIVKYLDLLVATYPHKREQLGVYSVATVPPELKKPLSRIRDALLQARASIEIKNIRKRGLRLIKIPQ